ncbi:regulatory protein RecX [Streptococcus pneumoniae]|nr:regulatory protein RecX [Streptococcus pneumoniae]VIU61979.1 regulatory protein RecX [Streptococcus pneumoniae]VIU81112.1 regulatory protein RecX [Streptococcus pneumoniae]VIY97689.1 regulatory protein RecX [Streptococcus pneumoniae]VIZ75934.1 regulatory protein RecX [Streptococcus pneumoniae]
MTRKSPYINLYEEFFTSQLSKSRAKIAFDELDSQVDEETTQELIFKELDKQYTKYARKYEGYELKQRLTQVLARKGYDFSDIASALREYL